MENYTRSEVIHIDDAAPQDTDPTRVHMKVTNGSKIRNLLGFALKKIKEDNIRQITWNAEGEAISKAISCAEIMKRKNKKLHQITNVRYVRTEEYWEPKLEGLERLKVNKDIPSMTILLSKDELDVNDPSYQAPGSIEPFSTRCNLQGQQAKEDHSKKAKSATRNKKSQFAPPAMERKRKRKPDNYQSCKNTNSQGQRNSSNNGTSKESCKTEEREGCSS